MSYIFRILDFSEKTFDYIIKMPWMLRGILLCTFMVLYVPLSYILSPDMYTNTPQASLFLEKLYIVNNMLLVLHICAALPAIVFGPFMFSAQIRKDHIKIHRQIGKIYIFGCMISAITVWPLAVSNGAGFIPRLGFGAMAVVWFFVTFWGYQAARNKDFVAHRRWMMRSYAMTFAFVHVNFTYKIFLPYEHLSVGGIKAFQSMISWQANLLYVEIYLAATTYVGKYVGSKRWLKNLSSYSVHDKFYWHAPVLKPA